MYSLFNGEKTTISCGNFLERLMKETQNELLV